MAQSRTALGRTIRSAGRSDRGRRDNNEDRCHEDADRGIFIVVDGVGGQAAGGEAADIAMKMLRTRLEQKSKSADDRIRQAIVAANNEIYRVAATHAKFRGMACVLTVAVIDGPNVVVGHVGDTRLYTLRDGHLQKITRDHSPVGEREDAGELTEIEAMSHPRRNEVFRDVGSEHHGLADPDFIDIYTVPFEDDAALLLCSDGLTDLVDAATIQQTIEDHAGAPRDAVLGLIAHANAAGGKDNITAIVVEGADFRGTVTQAADVETRELANPRRARAAQGSDGTSASPRGVWRWVRTIAGLLVLGAIGAASTIFLLDHAFQPPPDEQVTPPPRTITVNATTTIAAAMAQAGEGTDILVEPGEYRESIEFKPGVRLISIVPRGAIIRPPTASAAAVQALDAAGAALIGFRIIGGNTTATGILVAGGAISIADVEVTGMTRAAIDLDSREETNVVACDVHDNEGSALVLHTASKSRVAHCSFGANGTTKTPAVRLEVGVSAQLTRNTFQSAAAAITALFPVAMRADLARDNTFAPAKPATPAQRGRQ